MRALRGLRMALDGVAEAVGADRPLDPLVDHPIANAAIIAGRGDVDGREGIYSLWEL